MIQLAFILPVLITARSSHGQVVVHARRPENQSSMKGFSTTANPGIKLVVETTNNVPIPKNRRHVFKLLYWFELLKSTVGYSKSE